MLIEASDTGGCSGVGRIELFRVSIFGFRVIGADVQPKLFVALRLELAQHFIERCAGGRPRWFEAPATFRTTKTSKTLLLNPYQLAAHGQLCLGAPTRT